MTIELRRGRRSKYTYTGMPNWVLLLPDLSYIGYKIYSLLLAHVNSSRGDGIAWPTQKALAAMIGAHEDTVGKVISKELKPLGLIDVTVIRYGDNNSRKRNVYTVHEFPEEPFTGASSIPEWYELHPDFRTNVQVSPDPVYTPGPDPVSAPAPEPVLAPGPEAAWKPEETEESSTRRTLPPPPPSSGARTRDEAAEDLKAPSGGRRTQDEKPVEVTSEDIAHAKILLSAIPWPNKKMALGVTVKRTILDRLSALSAGGWEAEDITAYMNAQIPDWKRVRRAADLVASVLTDAPTYLREAFTDAPQAREEDTQPPADPELEEARAEHERLQMLRAQQKELIADCSVCDDMGWFIPVGGGTMLWHDHGKMGLTTEANRAGRKLAQIEEARAGEDQQVWEFARK